jgi:hypothetical protein
MCPCLSWQSARGSGTAYTTALLLVILDCILGGVRLVHLEAPIPPVVAWPDLASIPNCLQQRDTRNQPSARQKRLLGTAVLLCSAALQLAYALARLGADSCQQLLQAVPILREQSGVVVAWVVYRVEILDAGCHQQWCGARTRASVSSTDAALASCAAD